MKKIIVFLAVCVMVLCSVSCTKQETALVLKPESVTIKVGESVRLTPTIEGEGINILDIIRINPADEVCYLDKSYMVTGLKTGTSRVGIGVLKDKNDETKGMSYSAYTTVTVVE